MSKRADLGNPDLNSLHPDVRFTRRSFIASSLATGFALSAGPAIAQTAIKTSDEGLETGAAQISVQGGNMPAYFAAPKKAGKRATVIVIPEIWGMHEYQKDICRREDSVMLADLDALVAWVEQQPKVNAKKLGMTGMCRGGRTVWMYVAHSKKIKAGVAWYGGLNPMPPAMPLTPMDVADQLHAPVLGLYGGADQGIPENMVERMRAGLLAFGKDKESTIHVYPDMPHAFHADYRPSYRK
ncbi:MAG: dienelactone hydrolase family protein, partial [Proteobacteria bacterium]|nr:dienelactone hydrolase family protein [Pseudomonadota bacterium]